MSKSTDIEVDKRVTDIISLILNTNASRVDILQYGSKWDVSDRQIDDYIARAKEYIKDKFNTDREDILSEHLGRLYSLFEDANNHSDRRISLDTLKEIAKTVGLHAAEKKDITSNGESINFTIGFDKPDS